jgi:SPP1 gp7 family putative phage head morphogenesis protein
MYYRALSDIFRDWVRFPQIDSLDELFQRMNQLGNYAPAQQLDRLARGMVTVVAHGNAMSWRAAARESTQSGRIHRALLAEMQGPVGVQVQNIVRANAALIKTLPLRIAEDVNKQIATRQLRGERASTIAADMRKRMPHIAASRIRLIARTEVAKANEAIIKSRASALNLNWYQWLTSKDIRVRASHREMNLVLVNFNDPPSPEALVGEKSVGSYNAGNIYNCRCASAVIVDLDQVTFPALVYRSGSITRMTRSAFAKIAGGEVEK